MIEESRFYSIDPAARFFTGDAPEPHPATDEMRSAAELFAEPGYGAVASSA